MAADNLDRLRKQLNIKVWDYVLIGDGSGCGFDGPCGWACVLIERRTSERVPFYGCANLGTIGFAELMAYHLPLQWIAAKHAGGVRRCRVVHIVTDSSYAESAHKKLTPEKNAGVLAAVQAYKRLGLELHWHWRRRDTHELNRIADELSKQARRLIQAYNKQTYPDWLQQANQAG